MLIIFKSFISSFRRGIYEAMGNPRYSMKPALDGLDDKLSKYLNFRNGFFIEAGGNDGISQSNTYYLERGLGWNGVLIEAIPELFEKCRINRRRASVFNGALVSKAYEKSTLRMHYAGLMSIGNGAMPQQELKLHVEAGIQNLEESYEIDVPAVTFEQILNSLDIKRIDFLSLDVEGAELESLKGFNFVKHRPLYILIESRNLDETEIYLASKNYKLIDHLSPLDYLFKDYSNKTF